MEKELKKGIFITFEGPEGSGKSTQSKFIERDLISDGYKVLRTFEPGDTSLGARIRDILLEKDDIKLGMKSELLLFEADRAQHMEEVIAPALEAGSIVICDRFNTATFAYQGYGLGMDMGFIESVDRSATGGISPDLTILLDVDVDTGLARAGKIGRPDRMEKRTREFHEKVRQGYLDMAKKDPGKIKIIGTIGDIDQTYCSVKEQVYEFISGYKGTG